MAKFGVIELATLFFYFATSLPRYLATSLLLHYQLLSFNVGFRFNLHKINPFPEIRKIQFWIQPASGCFEIILENNFSTEVHNTYADIPGFNTGNYNVDEPERWIWPDGDREYIIFHSSGVSDRWV